MKTLLLALLTLSPTLASAASPEVLVAVLQSEALSQFGGGGHLDVTDVKETAIYRCPGCFTFEVTLGRNEAVRKASFNTRLKGFDGSKRLYEVTLKEEQAQ